MQGELYRVSAAALALLDDYEGGDYERAPIELLGRVTGSSAYFYIADANGLPPCGPVWTE